MKTRRQYEDEFKRMAVELADAKGSLKVTAEELGINNHFSCSSWTNARNRGDPAEEMFQPTTTPE